MGREVSRVGLRLEFADFDGLVGLHRDELIVDGGDVEVFSLTGTVAQVERLPQRRIHRLILPYNLIRAAKVRISHSEIAVQLDGPLKLGNRGRLLALKDRGREPTPDRRANRNLGASTLPVVRLVGS